MTANPKVFISHASEDKERFVLRFAERLCNKGIDVWLDKWEMLPGDKLVRKIFENGLKPSDAVIVVLSETSIKKPWVQRELDTAVVKNIEEQTRLVPIRLDKCEIPACLKDGTLYQEITDLNNYDSEFERIVNAIYGQYEKPLLGEIPSYVRPDVLDLDGLTQIDGIIFEHACRFAMKEGQIDVLSGKQLVSDLKEQGISETQIMETQDVLEGRYYFKLHRVLGPVHAYDYGITTYGLEEFAKAAIPDYAGIVTSIARFVAQTVSRTEGQYSSMIATETGQTIFLVEHVLKVLSNNGSIQCDGTLNDFYVYSVSPELRRNLET